MQNWMKIHNFRDALGPYSLLITGLPWLCWYVVWAHLTVYEVVGSLLIGAVLQPAVDWLARYVQGRHDPTARALFQLSPRSQNPANLLRSLDGVPRVALKKTLNGWVPRRTAYVMASYFLRELPFAIYAVLVIIPRLPDPPIGYWFLFFQWTSYLVFTGFYLASVQRLNVAGLRRLLAKQFKWPDVGYASSNASSNLASSGDSTMDALRDFGKNEFFFTGIFVFIAIVATLISWTLPPEKGMPTAAAFIVLFGWMFLVSLWLRYRGFYQYLMTKIDDYRVEIAEGLTKDMEVERMSALGQMAGLVIHDLAGNIGTIKLAVEQLNVEQLNVEQINKGLREGEVTKEKPNSSLVALSMASDKMEKLLVSLKGRMKNYEFPRENTANFGDCIDYMVNLMHLMELDPNAAAVPWQICVSDEAKSVMIALPKVELSQIMMNLGGNSIRAMRGVKNAYLKVAVASRGNDFVTFSLSDNGSGMTKKRFEEHINVGAFASNDRSKIREGLGLRLVSRMVERCGGGIEIDPKSDASGSIMYIRLPMV